VLAGTSSPAFDALVARLCKALQSDLAPLAAAEAAAACLRDTPPRDAVLTAEQHVGSDEGYVQHVLHVNESPTFSIVAVVWLPGQQTPIHSHICWGAVSVVQGVEDETTYRLCADDTGPHLREAGVSHYGPGDVTAFAPPNDVHRVRSGSRDTTISIHVYGADLRETATSILHVYPPESVQA
jgi:predicted metal-dependent enzyme (double-stranded beta helix superfamily)